MDSERPAATESGAPGWLWIAVLTAAVAVAVAGGVGVVLAMAGLYRWWAVIVGTAPIVAAAWRPIRSLARVESSSVAGSRWAVATAVVLVCIAGWSASRPGHHVITSHDPGVYASTAVLLERSGGLRTTVADPDTEPLVAATMASTPAASVTGAGAYQVEPTVLEYQFSHAPSTLMAAAGSIGGPRVFFGFSAAITMVALLGVYLLTSRFAPAPFAFASTVALGISVPVLYVSRSTYSEPLTLLTVGTALALVCRPGTLDARRSIVAGFLFGSSLLFRIDGQLIVVAMIAVGAVAAASGTRWRPLAAGLGAAAVPAAVGVVDLAVFSSPYWSAQETHGGLIAGAAILGVGATAALTSIARRPGFKHASTTWLPRLAWPAAAVTALVLAWAWLIRPSTQVARAAWEAGSNYADRVEGLQTAVGLAPDGTRSYAELTVASIGWYLGPAFVVLAIVGLSVLAWRSFASPDAPSGRLVAFFVVAGSVYLIDWQITPYQPWAARRFVTVVLPVFACAAAVGAATVVGLVRRWSRRGGSGSGRGATVAATWVLMALLVVPAVVSTWPVRNLAEQRGFYGVVQQACDVADGATALSYGSERMAIPMRAWCDIPTVSIAGSGADVDGVRTFIDTARALCEPAVVLVSDPALRPVLDASPSLGDVVEVAHTNPYFPEESVVGPPSRYTDQPVVVSIAPVDLPDSC